MWKGLLRFQAVRPTFYGLETHLASMHKLINEFRPQVVVLDPITNLSLVGDTAEVKSTLMRLVDFLKMQQITGLLTSLTTGNVNTEQTDVGVSSIVDTWLLLRDGGGRRFDLYSVRQSWRNSKRQDRQRKGQGRAGRSQGAFPRSTSSSSHRCCA